MITTRMHISDFIFTYYILACNFFLIRVIIQNTNDPIAKSDFNIIFFCYCCTLNTIKFGQNAGTICQCDPEEDSTFLRQVASARCTLFAKSRKRIREIHTCRTLAGAHNVPVASGPFVIPDLGRDKISIYKCPTAAISKTEGQIGHSYRGCTVSGTLVLLVSTRLLSMQMHESNKLLNTLRGIYPDRFSKLLSPSSSGLCCVCIFPI